MKQNNNNNNNNNNDNNIRILNNKALKNCLDLDVPKSNLCGEEDA